MANENGNGKNGSNGAGTGGNGNGNNGTANGAKPGGDSNGNGSNGTSNGAKPSGASNGTGGASASNGGGGGATQIQEGPVTITPQVPPVMAPASSVGPALVTTGVLALGGGLVYGFYRWRQKSITGPNGTPLPGGSPPAGPTGPAAPTGGTTPAGPATPADAPQGAVDPDYWGTTKLGEEYRPLLKKIEQVTGMPIRLYLSVVANREAGWNRKIRNTDAVETAASKRAIEAGPERGNPPPKYSASLAGAGSGGLFGALAPYVAWTGLDEDYMPYLDEDYTIIENPIVAAICAAKYYQRIVTYYPTVFATPGTPRSEDHYRVRLGWARPEKLKNDPAGELFKAVKGRMDEDLAELGLKITDLPPPNSARWPGLRAVVEAMQGFPVTWK